MLKPGTMALLRFPHGDFSATKLRPVLIIAKAPSPYGDWLVCLVSTQIQHCMKGVDEILDFNDSDYRTSGVKTKSLIRVGQLLTTDKSNFVGEIGSISKARLIRVKQHITNWIHPHR